MSKNKWQVKIVNIFTYFCDTVPESIQDKNSLIFQEKESNYDDCKRRTNGNCRGFPHANPLQVGGNSPGTPRWARQSNWSRSFCAILILPRMLTGQVLRSPYAHARIVSIDTTSAEAMPGVEAVITAKDFPVPGRQDFVSRNLMARDKVLYEGQVLAAVAARTRRQAKEAVEKIVVEYEQLPPVLNIDEAMAENAPLLHDDLITEGADPMPTKASNVSKRTLHERGDLAVGFAQADLVIEREFSTKVVHQGYIEPHAAVADTSKDGRSDIWCSSQGHFMVRSATARMLGWENSRIKVTPAEIGGGFGGKTTIYLEPLAVKLSEKAKRPVKLVMSRSEVFQATGPTPATKFRVKLGVRKDGKITAGQARFAYESGGFPGSWARAGAMCVFTPYNIPNFKIEGFDVVVNKPVNMAYRAPSSPMGAFATDSILDEIACELKIDPIELRMINAVKEGCRRPDGPVFARIGFKETLEAIRNHSHYKSPLAPNPGTRGGKWVLAQRRRSFLGNRQSQRKWHCQRNNWQSGYWGKSCFDGIDGC